LTRIGLYIAAPDDTRCPPGLRPDARTCPGARAMSSDPSGPLNVLRPPVILLGTHRSGTSLIARLLDELGLFQGAELQEDHESVYFLEVNDLLLKRVGASWDNPAPVRDFLENPEALDLTARCVRA